MNGGMKWSENNRPMLWCLWCRSKNRLSSV